MRRFRKAIALLGLLVLGAVAGSCERAELTAPQEEFALQAAKSSPFRMLSGKRAVSGEAEVRLTTHDAAGHVLTVRDGQRMVAGLEVRPGTVKPNTRFTLRVDGQRSVNGAAVFHVELTATSWNAKNQNDIGQKGFKKPVLLYINVDYLELQGAADGELRIAELKVNGTLAPTRSWLERREGETYLVGQLPHFSGWVPIAD